MSGQNRATYLEWIVQCVEMEFGSLRFPSEEFTTLEEEGYKTYLVQNEKVTPKIVDPK